MLKYMPLAGSILLTLIILWIIVYTVRQNRRRVRLALTGTYYRSTCCGSTATPFGWSQDGWISTCDNCGAWQYHGDDYDHPPRGFTVPPLAIPSSRDKFTLEAIDEMTPGLRRAREHFADLEQTLSRHPAPRPAAKSPPLDEPQDLASGGVIPCCRMALCVEPIFQLGLCKDHWRWINAVEVTSDEELLQMPPPPNIGGEDHPPYEGPHYDVEHERFVPYDVIGEPVEGTAVHMIGDTAFAGPLPEIAEWRCVHCKTVVASNNEPKRCVECGRKQFVRINS